MNIIISIFKGAIVGALLHFGGSVPPVEATISGVMVFLAFCIVTLDWID